MVDVMQKASSWLEAQRRAFRSVTVLYRRGAMQKDVCATIGSSQFDLDNGAGGVLRLQTRDYLIAVADLAAAGFAHPPRAGDQIVDACGGAGGAVTYEVVSPTNALPVWVWSDRYHIRIRLHTILATKEQ
ncbi:MAG: hypothetical protein WCI73_10285 [Phycisphaerae bacterium]